MKMRIRLAPAGRRILAVYGAAVGVSLLAFVVCGGFRDPYGGRGIPPATPAEVDALRIAAHTVTVASAAHLAEAKLQATVAREAIAQLRRASRATRQSNAQEIDAQGNANAGDLCTLRSSAESADVTTGAVGALDERRRP